MLTPSTTTIHANDFHRIKNGVIVETWHLEDIFALLQQIGAIPTR